MTTSPSGTPDPQVARDVAAMLEENARTRAAFLAALDGVPESRIPDRWFDGWSLREIVAHVAAWEDGFATALELATRGERSVVPGFDSSLGAPFPRQA